MERALFIFRRDLRTEDNTGLIEAHRASEEVLPCFIFDPRQTGKENKHRSQNALQFLIESVQDLGVRIEKRGGRLAVFYGRAEDVVLDIIKEGRFDSVYINRDYTPFSRSRDKAIRRACEKKGASFHCFSDLLLNEPEAVLRPNGKPYTVFTHFYRRSLLEKVRPVRRNPYKNYYTGRISSEAGLEVYEKILPEKNVNIAAHGGRREAKNIISVLDKYKNYEYERNYPAYDATTHLSTHLKFGTCSVREVYYGIVKKLGVTHPLIRQLYWRDFFTHIGYHFPKVFGKSFNERFDYITWSYNKENFKRWCEGKTGFPIVDAGMRELNATGYMHNRLRMIVSSFLVKDLHIDWRWGEKYFAQKLVDYDPCVNNGNWQWSASTGCDAQPYFRIFNPWMQQKKYDPDCVYIKRWVPELSGVPANVLHSLGKKRTTIKDYPEPMVDHALEAVKAKTAFRAARSSMTT